MQKNSYDVIIVGGGTAGVVAAIQSGRAGAKTLLVEKCGMLGGTLTVGGVHFPSVFYAWGKQVIKGIGYELCVKALKEESKCPPAASSFATLSKQHALVVNPALYAMICDEETTAAGVEILLHAMPAEVKRTGRIWKITLCTKEGLQDFSAKVIIDCTGDANVVKLSGFKTKKQKVIQPATTIFSINGYEFEKLNKTALVAGYKNAIKKGLFTDAEFGWGGTELGDRLLRLLGGHGLNSVHVNEYNADGSKGKTALELRARALILKIYRWLRKQRGLEKLEISFLAPECGIRETVVIDGKAFITIKDYESGRLWPDALCYSFYPIDVHTNKGTGLILRNLKDGILPTIPRGAMLPKGSRFLIAAGRHISGDREAHSAYRVQASCMAMGQAAGAMAALSAKKNIDPEQLPLSEIQNLLEKHGAIIPR